MATDAPAEHLGMTENASEDEQGSEHVPHVVEGKHASALLDTSSRAREPEAQSYHVATAPKSQQASSLPAWALLLLGSAAAGALLLWRNVRRRGRGGKLQPVEVPKERVFAVPLSLGSLAPAQSQSLAPLPPLTGRVLVVSDRLDVEGVQTRFGSDAWQAGRQPSSVSYAALGPLRAAGVQVQAVVAAECMGLGPLPTSGAGALPNPVCRGRSNGGGDYGAAVAIAAGHADLALAVDELGSARVPAACCGVYAFRVTSGVLPLEGVSTASHSLAAPTLLARDPHLLLKAGEALRLPGGGSRGEVATYLVAEDYFAQCSPRCRAAVPAVIAAVKRWAGPDQAQGLSLCEWLYHRLQRLRMWMEEEQAAEAEAEGASAGGRQEGQPGRRGRSVLRALASVAETIRQYEFGQKYGQWVQQQGAGGLPLEAVRFQEQAAQVSEERYRSAQAVMADLAQSLRAALQEGYVFVLPTMPGEAPPSSSGSAAAAAAEEFRQQALQFSALAALAGVPQVTLPLPVPGQLPLSISLMGLHKKDLSLLQAAAKLGPLLAEEAAKLAEQQHAAPQHGGSSSSGAAAGKGKGGGQGAAAGAKEGRGAGSSSSGGSGSSSKKKGAAGDAEAERRARAELCKEEGNTAFRARKYEEAVRHYSTAVQLEPKNPTYYNNRAQAYLKLGLYSQAEQDCDAALGLELNVKALLRRGSARVAQGDAEGAKADFRQALALEPQNKQARQELQAIEQMEAALQPGGY